MILVSKMHQVQHRDWIWGWKQGQDWLGIWQTVKKQKKIQKYNDAKHKSWEVQKVHTRERGVDKDRAEVEYLRWWFGRKMVTLQKTSSQPGFSPRGNSHEYEKHRLSCKAFTLRSRFYSQLFRLPHTLFSITIINGHLHFQQYPFSASELLL